MAVVDTLQSRQVELTRLRKLIGDLKSVGHTGIASALEESVSKVVDDIAKLTASPQTVTQQQQQVQPKDKK